MSITVAEALKIGALKKCRLLAGKKNIHNIINFVDTMEVPDITSWLKSNELLVTTAYSIKDDKSALVNLVENLKQVKAAGLAIKPRFMGEIPKEIINLAEQLDLPLIEIPVDISFIEIIHPLMKAITNRQAKYLEFSETAHRELTKVVLEGNGMQDIIETLHSLIGNVVIITDEHLRICATAGFQPLESLPLGHTKEKDGAPNILLSTSQYDNLYKLIGTTWLNFPNCPWTICVRPSRVREKVYGYTFIVEKEKPVKDLELIALEHAATTISLEFIKRDVFKEHFKRLEQDFFTDLISGHIANKEEAEHRAEMLNWPGGPWIIVSFDIDSFDTLQKQHSEKELQEIKQKINDLICYVLKRKLMRFSLLAKSDSFTCLLSIRNINNPTLIESFITEVQETLLNNDKITISAGISNNFQEILKFADNYRDARTALKISRLTKGRGTYGHVEQYLLERVLLEMASHELISEYYAKVFGTLEAYDVMNNTNLVQTVEALVQNMGLKSTTATALYVHRNTLTYRLKKIEMLTGLNLSRSEDLIGLAMALKLRPFIQKNK